MASHNMVSLDPWAGSLYGDRRDLGRFDVPLGPVSKKSWPVKKESTVALPGPRAARGLRPI